MNPNSKNTTKVVGQVIIILVIGGISMWLASLFSNTKNNTEEIATKVAERVEKVVVKKPQCLSTFDDYQKIKQDGQTITLLENLNSYGIAGDGFAKMKTVTVKRIGSGSEVACGYLHLLGTKDEKPLDSWENFYVKAGEFGGHLSNDGAIMNQKTSTSTETLWNLNNISFRKDKNTNALSKADWSALLNVSDMIDFDIALNTTNTKGSIIEVSITYKCWNPDTGNITKDCNLEVVK